MKKVLSVLMVLCMVVSLCSCSFAQDVIDSTVNVIPSAKVFENDGISIELTTDFLRMDFVSEEYEFIIGNDEITLLASKVDFGESVLKDYSVSEFASYFREILEEYSPGEITDMDGIPTMNYIAESDGEKSTDTIMFYKSSNCFWILEFVVDTDEYEKYYEDICKYAKSVKCE